ncbi:YbhB/YbcL family Raf kinase inhibitor-like protein [Brachybacterium sp. EF45031]|uniref:YbhB/YbcL family Raf kinase inhibitor-like protein n=1 Tax=Brachybacterium sillae TaxID=2810536 RepID=UPI00217D9DDC|nr:YbhB/YbcL family Raf kinase inhibitor-like protein [Brachybacterium sillae]MCS6712539.1 YbhB/YbcL family Raf kinase inhibitor-like protein [Brachybacterium sillae]
MSTDQSTAPSSLTVTSRAVPEGSVIAAQQLVEDLGGENLSPDLAWSGAPEGTKSFAVTCYDPDAPTGSGFWHWIAWDIPADVTSLPLGVPRDADTLKQTANDYGSTGYDGPNPPEGPAHRYVFTVHALPVESLGVEAGTPHVQVRFAIHTQQLASGSVTGTYQAGS